MALNKLLEYLEKTKATGGATALPPPQAPPSTSTGASPVLEAAIKQAMADIELRSWFKPAAKGPLWTPSPDAIWLDLVRHPSVVLIIGKRGSGKSAFGYRLLELQRDRAAPYVVGLPSQAQKLLPEWIGFADRLEDVPPGAVVLFDEAYTRYNARESMTADGRGIGTAVNLSRQRVQTLIFIVQEARQLDVNVISQADVIAIKALSEISQEFERKELRRFTDRARAAFSTVKGNSQSWTWVHSEAADFQGMVMNRLASFWRPALSHAFSGAVGSQRASGRPITYRQGERTPKAGLESRARAMHNAGHSYGQIAKILGVSKSTVYELVNGRK